LWDVAGRGSFSRAARLEFGGAARPVADMGVKMDEGASVEPIPYAQGGKGPPAAVPVDGEWRGIVLRGLWVGAAMALVSTLHAVMGHFPGLSPNNSAAPRIGVGIEVAYRIGFVLSAWWITQPDPGESAGKLARWIRVLAVVHEVAALYSVFFSIGAAGTLIRASVAAPRVTVAMVMSLLFFLYLSRLCKRIGAPRLDFFCMIVMTFHLVTMGIYWWFPWMLTLARRMHLTRVQFIASPIVMYACWLSIAAMAVLEGAMAMELRKALPIGEARARGHGNANG
jgi:hypothetical protein